MQAKFIRAGGIAALLVPVALWGGGLLAVTLVSGMKLPGAAGGVFEAALGAVAPLLIAGALVATWGHMDPAGRGGAGLMIFPLAAVLLVCVLLYAALGSIAIFTNDLATRNLQGAGAFAYALCFGLAFLFGVLLIRHEGAGRGLWIASGILYIIAALLAAPSWAVLAIEIWDAGNTTARFTRNLAALLGLLFGTLLVLPIACLCHGIALLHAARCADGAGVTSAG